MLFSGPSSWTTALALFDRDQPMFAKPIQHTVIGSPSEREFALVASLQPCHGYSPPTREFHGQVVFASSSSKP
ncbi:hypothetical protein CY34DRAFT_813115 [Suillus luteus UH-Slu-Lm8-n1]|uniref:Uncharacterized protein n=1 Tax=Suillus luteus UH-Slu-Lm8-n1 TaxID=930992 RepID=A0A0C9Z9E6_9AGAM|nr:hypothetical protein CY34DRAFT_813115 [Suillus luteus UH-Slu-Lm8-n1]